MLASNADNPSHNTRDGEHTPRSRLSPQRDSEEMAQQTPCSGKADNEQATEAVNPRLRGSSQQCSPQSPTPLLEDDERSI